MDLGFRVKNFITLVGLLLLVACVPTAKETKCPGSQAYDSNLRTCVPSLSSSGNSIFVTAKSPSNSYAMSLTDAPIAHSITVTDVYSSGYQVRWFVNFSNPPTTIANQLVASGTTSYAFDPDGGMLFNAGAYTLEAVVYDASGLSVVDSESWAITVHPDDIPTIVNINPTSPSITLANDIGAFTFEADVLNVDDQVGTYEWYLNGALQGAAAAIPTGGGTTPQPVTDLIVNPSGLSNGTHSVTLTLYDGGGGVFNSFTWGILVTDPNLPIVTSYAPSAPDIIDAVDGVAQAAGGYMQNGLPLTFTFTVDDYLKLMPDTLEVQIKLDGGSVYSQAFAANTINISTGIPALNLANSQIPETHTLEAIIKTTGSNRVAASYTWTIDLRPTNTSPVLTINHATGTLPCNATTPVSPTSSTDLEGKGCAINQDVPITVVGILEDEDYLNAATTDYTHFGITFSIDGENMDGTATLSDDVCSTVPNGANTAAILTCSFTLDSFSTTGPIAPGTYELTAQAVDDGSPFSVTPANSNEVKWTIDIGEAQTAPVIQAQELALGSLPSITNTYFEQATTACIGTGSYYNNTLTAPVASELSYLLVHTAVQDAERDNFLISIDMENANPALPAGIYTNISPPQLVTRVDNTLNYIHTTCIQIPEWVRWAGTDGAVNVRVSVVDQPSLVGTGSLGDSETLSLYVVNNNPRPEFTVTTPESPLIGGSYNVYAGFPFTLDPGSIVDSSTIDGQNISYQWEVNYNVGGWQEIEGATSAGLTWTPSPTVLSGDNVQLRLCLGDDGGNAADCTIGASTKTWPNITVAQNNTNALIGAPSSDQAASWFDDTQKFLYQARHNGGSIFIDKLSVNGTTGAQTFVETINFGAEDGLINANVTDLSVTGVDATALYIAYKIIDTSSTFPRMYLRRIELRDDNFHFQYDLTIVGSAVTGHGLASVGASAREVNLDFSSVPDPGDVITMNGIDITIGTDICIAASCADADDVITELVTWLGSISAPPVLRFGIDTSAYVGGNDNVDLVKFDDFCDFPSKVTPVVGKLVPQPNAGSFNNPALIYLPYTDISNNQQISYASVLAGSSILSCPDPTGGHSQIVGAATFVQDLDNDIDLDGNHHFVLKNSTGNIDVHSTNAAFGVTSSATNIFALGTYTAIKSPTISVGETAINENVFVSALFETAGLVNDLGVGIFEKANFANFNVVSTFNSAGAGLDLNADIINSRVLASPSEDQAALVGIVNNDGGNYQTYMTKITIDNAVYTGASTALKFEDRSYPTLSSVAATTDSYLFFSKPYQLTYGDAGDTALENQQFSIFVSHHPANNAETILINTQEMTSSETSDDTVGTYPGYIPAN